MPMSTNSLPECHEQVTGNYNQCGLEKTPRERIARASESDAEISSGSFLSSKNEEGHKFGMVRDLGEDFALSAHATKPTSNEDSDDEQVLLDKQIHNELDRYLRNARKLAKKERLRESHKAKSGRSTDAKHVVKPILGAEVGRDSSNEADEVPLRNPAKVKKHSRDKLKRKLRNQRQQSED